MTSLTNLNQSRVTGEPAPRPVRHIDHIKSRVQGNEARDRLPSAAHRLLRGYEVQLNLRRVRDPWLPSHAAPEGLRLGEIKSLAHLGQIEPP